MANDGIIYLTGSTNDTIEAALIEAGWGLMMQPGTYNSKRGRRYPWTGMDNGCFWPKSYVGHDRWLDWLDRQDRDRCLFAVVPDVARRPDGSLGGDPAATWDRFREFGPLVREMGFPAALAAQDGCEKMPDFGDQLDACDCLFLAGSDRWKLSAAALGVAGEARRRGKWVHMGRVNSFVRVDMAAAMGCQSVDGTFLAGPFRKVVEVFERHFETPYPRTVRVERLECGHDGKTLLHDWQDAKKRRRCWPCGYAEQKAQQERREAAEWAAEARRKVQRS